jgi:phosphoribosyl-ATP pyrophosphohydrolase
MTYLVVVDTTEENKVSKYQLCKTQEEASEHIAKVKDNYANSYMVSEPANLNFDYLVADISNKTLTFDQVSWDSDQNAIASTQYQRDRQPEYPPMADYLDGIVKGDKKQINQYVDDCLAVKQKYPKP